MGVQHVELGDALLRLGRCLRALGTVGANQALTNGSVEALLELSQRIDPRMTPYIEFRKPAVHVERFDRAEGSVVPLRQNVALRLGRLGMRTRRTDRSSRRPSGVKLPELLAASVRVDPVARLDLDFGSGRERQGVLLAIK